MIFMIVAVEGVRCAHPARHIAWENFPVPMYYLTYRKEKGIFSGAIKPELVKVPASSCVLLLSYGVVLPFLLLRLLP